MVRKSTTFNTFLVRKSTIKVFDQKADKVYVINVKGAFMTRYEQNEKDFILESLRLMKGNRTHAAKYIGIGLRTLQRKLKKYGELNYMILQTSHKMPDIDVDLIDN